MRRSAPILWLISAIESVAAAALFALTLSVDRAAFHHETSLPSWVISGSPDQANITIRCEALLKLHARASRSETTWPDLDSLTAHGVQMG